jgi:ergothioneine biosynthesis protein EgtB
MRFDAFTTRSAREASSRRRMVEDFARQALLDRRFRAIRNVTACLCQSLSAEDCAVQSMPDASPAKWHLAHTTWFFETFVLRPNDPDYGVFHPRFEYLFNSYYNSVGDQYPRAERGLLTRPSLDEIGRYRAHVETAMTGLLTGSRRLDEQVLDVIELGLNHEQQHQELLLTDIKHLLSCNPLAPAFRATKEPRSTPDRPLAWHAYEGGLVEIGSDGNGFAFDNELPRHRVYLEPFELASRPVRNDEYLAFVEDDGYARPEFWLAEGWAKIQESGWRTPLYWTRDDDQWWTFTLSGLRPLRMEEPVCHVSFYEADAFARWSGGRLPTEAEWERVAMECPIEGNFLEGGRFHPDAASPRARHDAPDQLHGDVWEWTASPYSPYPGFRATSGAIGEYNGKFMASQFVLRGGSCVSPRSHLRASYRNFFYPDARWQFSGVRLARDTAHVSG